MFYVADHTDSALVWSVTFFLTNLVLRLSSWIETGTFLFLKAQESIQSIYRILWALSTQLRAVTECNHVHRCKTIHSFAGVALTTSKTVSDMTQNLWSSATCDTTQIRVPLTECTTNPLHTDSWSFFGKRSSLFWDVMQRGMVASYRRFGTTYRSHLQESALRNIPYKRRSHLYRGGILKSRVFFFFECGEACIFVKYTNKSKLHAWINYARINVGESLLPFGTDFFVFLHTINYMDS